MLLAALALAPSALAVDAQHPRFEQDAWRSRQDLSAVGLVVAGLGVIGGASAVLVEDEMLTGVLGAQGTLFLAGGSAVTAIAGLSARDYPLERKSTLVPATLSLGLAGLSAGGLLVWAANDNEDLNDPLLYGTLGVAGASGLAAIWQMGANSSAWNDRQDDKQASVAIVPWASPKTTGAALVGVF